MKRNGFTFVELLIAVVIGAFVTVTAVAAMSGIVSGRQKHQHLTDLTDQMRYACGLIKNDLNNIYRSNDFSKAKYELSYLDADGDISCQSLTFYTVSRKKARAMQPEGDVYEVQYVVKSDVETGLSVLMRRCCPVVPGVQIAENTQPGGILSPVAENIVGLQVRCYDGIEWTDEWNERNGQFPLLMEVALLAGEKDSKKTLKRSLFINLPRMKSSQADSQQEEEEQEQDYESYMNNDFSATENEGAEK